MTHKLLQVLREQMESRLKGSIYHRTQIELTYNSNHIEGSLLSKEQTRFIFETNTLGATTGSTRVDDIIETVNHFSCVDYVIKPLQKPLFEDVLDFHVRFERIHPFQDGNGRVGRLLMFWQCLKADIVPIIITEELRYFYYRGLQNWGKVNGFLTDTCLTAQDEYKEWLRYFRI